MINNNSIEKTAIEIGKSMIENGAEINRCEDTIIRILKSHNIKQISVFCISSLLILQTENTTEIRRISSNDLDLFKIDMLNSKSRSLCNHDCVKGYDNNYSIVSKIIMTFLATSSFCLYFGGSIFDSILAGIIGLILNEIKISINSVFAKTLCYSIIGGILCLIPCLIFKSLSIDKIMIGTIMLLIPGLTIGNAIRDIMLSDTISGIIELTDAIFTAIAITFGYALSLWIYKYV